MSSASNTRTRQRRPVQRDGIIVDLEPVPDPDAEQRIALALARWIVSDLLNYPDIDT